MGTCLIPDQWEVVRITPVDACGRPIYGACAVVSRCIATIADSADVTTADTRTQTGFDGKPCYTRAGCDTVNFHTLEVTWSQISMDGFRIMNPGLRASFDPATGEVIGLFANNKIECSAGYAVEVWASAGGSNDACTGEDGVGAWYYRVYPWVTGGTPGDLTMGGTDEVSFVMTGRTKTGTRWGKGPYQITLSEGVPAGLPDAFDPALDEPFWEGIVTLPPPQASCDCEEVPRPIPEPATVVVTGVDGESPRRTARLMADNAGLGPVTVDWGDGTPVQDVAELTTVSHTYAGTVADPVTIKVCDKTEPTVCRQIGPLPLPLPDPATGDKPVLAFTAADDATHPNRVSLEVTLPAQAYKMTPQQDVDVVIDWGDQQTSSAKVSQSTGKATLTHDYKYPGRYRVCASWAKRKSISQCQVTYAPIPADAAPPAALAPAGAASK